MATMTSMTGWTLLLVSADDRLVRELRARLVKRELRYRLMPGAGGEATIDVPDEDFAVARELLDALEAELASVPPESLSSTPPRQARSMRRDLWIWVPLTILLVVAGMALIIQRQRRSHPVTHHDLLLPIADSYRC